MILIIKYLVMSEKEVEEYFKGGSGAYPLYQASFMEGSINLTVRGTDEQDVIRGLRAMIEFYNETEIEKKEKTEVAKTVYASKESPSCPECGGEMVKRDGQYGAFWGCQKYPECKGLIKIKE